jgi:hypothetical protein
MLLLLRCLALSAVCTVACAESTLDKVKASGPSRSAYRESSIPFFVPRRQERKPIGLSRTRSACASSRTVREGDRPQRPSR